MEWISVKNETPKELDTVLIYDAVSDLTISIGHLDKNNL